MQLQPTSDDCCILISHHIVIRALDCNWSMRTRLMNRRSRCIGRAVRILDDTIGSWRCSENGIRFFRGYIGCQMWTRMSGAQRLFRIHRDSLRRSIIGIRNGLQTKASWSCLRAHIRMSLTRLTVDSVRNSCKLYKYNSHLYEFRNKSYRLCVERPLEL